MTGVTAEIAQRRELAYRATCDAKADNPKKAFGDQKPCAHYLVMGVFKGVAEEMKVWARKYGLRNWRKQPIKASTYYDGMMRHIDQWYNDLEDKDVESQRHHLEHVIANAMIVLDSIERGVIVDDRDECEVLTGGIGE